MSTPIGDGRSSQLTMRLPIPYELFLHIIDYIIIGAAEKCFVSETWYMGYRVDGLKENNQIIDLHTGSKNAEGNRISSKSNTNKPVSKEDSGKYDTSSIPEDKWWPREAQFSLWADHDGGQQRRRHNVTRLPSQINRQTRAMTHRKFLRFPIEGSPVDGWLLMEIDDFIPNLRCSDEHPQPFPFAASLALHDIMLQPPPGLKSLFDKIRSVHIESVTLFQEDNREDLEAILALKSLVMVSFRIGDVDESGLSVAQKTGIIDWYFPDLSAWVSTHGTSFSRLWKPFGDRNISLVAEDLEEAYWMQLLETSDGIRVAFPFDDEAEDYDSEGY